MIIKDIKLCPLRNPNCEIINSDEDLLEKFKNHHIPVIYAEAEHLMGETMGDGYIKDDCIYGSIEVWDKSDLNLIWENATVRGNLVGDKDDSWEVSEYANIAMSIKE